MYRHNGGLFRFVARRFQTHFDRAVDSGLYKTLTEKGLLLPFETLNEQHFDRTDCYQTLRPVQLELLSYPWEWCFDQLKDAALVTLDCCAAALKKGMILKDATPLNVQFFSGRPVFIDHLSFEQYKEGEAWIAYRQFCECFLNPLLLAAYNVLDVHELYRSFPEGLSASRTARMLPARARFNTGILLHVHLNAGIKTGSQPAGSPQRQQLSGKNITQILEHLRSIISKLQFKRGRTTWNNYYEETVLSNEYLENKKQLVSEFIAEIHYQTALDLGANDGVFSLLCSDEARVVAADADSHCINRLYQICKKQRLGHILPLVQELTHPSPPGGWELTEQVSFHERTFSDLCLALALVHHLAIGKNITLNMLASSFRNRCRYLLIEFVPKEDPKVQQLLANRTDIFDDYRQDQFESTFCGQFHLLRKKPIPGSARTLYLFERAKQ